MRADRQAGSQTARQPDRQAGSLTDREKISQTDSHTVRHTGKQAVWQTGSQTVGQIDSKTVSQSVRQSDSRADRQTDRKTWTLMDVFFPRTWCRSYVWTDSNTVRLCAYKPVLILSTVTAEECSCILNHRNKCQQQLSDPLLRANFRTSLLHLSSCPPTPQVWPAFEQIWSFNQFTPPREGVCVCVCVSGGEWHSIS